MKQIYSTHIEPDLPRLVRKYSQPQYAGHFVELWVFSDKATRLDAEKQLCAKGVNARVRSAYKPLLHFAEEELGVSGQNLERLVVKYPVNKQCQPNRFSLESYPLGAIAGLDRLELVPDETSELNYHLEMLLQTGEEITNRVFAPNILKSDLTGSRHLSPSGWVRIWDADKKVITDEPVYTDYERVFDSILSAVSGYDWPEDCFEQLVIKVSGPFAEEPLPYAHEHISLGEALHEDLYFSVQEWFRHKAGKAQNDRDFRFGQIVPDISSQSEAYQVEVCLCSYDDSTQQVPWQELEMAAQPLSSSQVTSELRSLGGEHISTLSVSGRAVQAVYQHGEDHPVYISGGQHANETTGVIGALRGAKEIADRKESHFVASPLENPDGYETYLRLLQANPTHMHHAARYTALGNDLDTHDPQNPYENAIRIKANSGKRVKLHINLHGYPSHEWVRPFSGYIPKGFDKWTLPKGFFLILRYSDEGVYRSIGRELIWRLTKRLTSIPGLAEFNRKQIALFTLHAGQNDISIVNDIPCIVSRVEESSVPLQLISEFPDETIYGSDFRFGHDVQKAVVTEAYDIFQTLMRERGARAPSGSLF